MIDWTQCDAIERHADKVSGAWVFRGARVPATALFENLEGGAGIGDFLSWFPGVAREQVTAVLEYAIKSLKEDPMAAWCKLAQSSNLSIETRIANEKITPP